MLNNFMRVLLVIFIVQIPCLTATICGCKVTRACYKKMIDNLKGKDEVLVDCVEDASIGVSTVMIYLKAIQQFCPELVTVFEDDLTYEGRRLYEVVLNASSPARTVERQKEEIVFILEAGQYAGTESVGLVLFVIEQLVACQENNNMLANVKWVILPSVNPDGMEYGRNRVTWRKNMKPSEDGLSYGVDISRNFDTQWSACEPVESGFAMSYPGLSPGSENETVFIKNVLSRYKGKVKLYLSIRRDGHGILYPHAYTNEAAADGDELMQVAADVAAKVNQRAGGVQSFANQSIYEYSGKAHCGHSVDYAYDMDIPFSYEMRVFLGNDKRIISKFQQLPRGFEATLRYGYYSGIKQLFNIITDKKRQRIKKKVL